MQKSNAPVPYALPWANTGTKNAIPVASQIGITNGAASFTDGYPPLTFTPIASGGVPPFGSDTNGILYDETLNTLWQQSGFKYAFSSTFSTNQGGYPAQALLSRLDGKGFWLNLSDNNTTNPDTTSPSGWTSVRANIGTSTIAVVVGNNTPDPSTLGPRLLIITGSIASTASLILPLTAGSSWVISFASGAGALSVQGATGSGVTVAQGTVSEVITDGTNFYTSTFNGAGVYLPIAGTAVAATKLATARTIAISGEMMVWSVNFDGSANVTSAGTIQAGSVTLAKMANLTGNTLLGNPTGSAAAPSAVTLAAPLVFTGGSLALSYTPVNRAGDTMTGPLSINETASAIALMLQTQLSLALVGIKLVGDGSATPSKTMRVASGAFQIINDANTAAILTLNDAGTLSVPGNVNSGGNFQTTQGAAAYNVLQLTNTSGVQVQVNANANSSGGLLTTTAHQLILGTNTATKLTLNVGPPNPATSVNTLNAVVSGSFGGGFGIIDGANSWGIWDQAGVLIFGGGATGGALTAAFSIGAAGTATITGAGGNGAQLFLNGNGGTTPNKLIRARAGSLEFVNSANSAIIATLDDAGNLTANTGNFTSSDVRLKHDIAPATLMPLHRLAPLMDFKWNDGDRPGRSPIAQAMRDAQPIYVYEYEHFTEGSDRKRLGVERSSVALETAYWAATEVDKLWDELRSLRQLVLPAVN